MSLHARLAATLQRTLHREQAYTETLATQRVRNGIALGFIDLDAAGEAVAHVQFPMMFSERPVFTFGLELGENAYVVPGDFPLATATVLGWTIRNEALTTLYTGADLAIAITGGIGKLVCHYQFQARSFTNPTSTVTTVGAAI